VSPRVCAACAVLAISCASGARDVVPETRDVHGSESSSDAGAKRDAYALGWPSITLETASGIE